MQLSPPKAVQGLCFWKVGSYESSGEEKNEAFIALRGALEGSGGEASRSVTDTNDFFTLALPA